MMKKGLRKGLIISTSIVLGVVLTAQIGALVALPIIVNTYVNRRSIPHRGVGIYNTCDWYQRDELPLLSERETYTFSSNNETITGYLYEVDNPKGVVLCAHGIDSNADTEDALYQNYFVENGWDVFALDLVGCGASTGTQKSLYEPKYNIKDGVNFLKTLEKTKDLGVCLFGFSWGGYGVVMASSLVEVDAVCAMATYESPILMYKGMAMTYAGDFAKVTFPFLDVANALIYGNENNLRASEVIKNNKDTNYFVLNSDNDDTIDFNYASLYHYVKDMKLDNLTTWMVDGLNHMDVAHSPKAIEAIGHFWVDHIKKWNVDEHDGEMYPIEEAKKVVEELGGKEVFSELNSELMGTIENIFLESVKN